MKAAQPSDVLTHPGAPTRVAGPHRTVRPPAPFLSGCGPWSGARPSVTWGRAGHRCHIGRSVGNVYGHDRPQPGPDWRGACRAGRRCPQRTLAGRHATARHWPCGARGACGPGTGCAVTGAAGASAGRCCMSALRVHVSAGECEDSWWAACSAPGCGWQIAVPSQGDARAWGMWHDVRCAHRGAADVAARTAGVSGYATWRHVAGAGGLWHRPVDPVQPVWCWRTELLEMVCGACLHVVEVADAPGGSRCPACYYEEPTWI